MEENEMLKFPAIIVLVCLFLDLIVMALYDPLFQ